MTKEKKNEAVFKINVYLFPTENQLLFYLWKAEFTTKLGQQKKKKTTVLVVIVSFPTH